MGWNLFLIGRVYQFACAAVVLGCSAYVAHYMRKTHYEVPGAINFLLFAPTFTFFTLVYNTLPWIVPSFYHPAAVLVCIAVEVLNFVFWLAGFAAVTAFLTNLRVCTGPICAATKTGAAFSFFSMAGYLATTIGLIWWLYHLRKDIDELDDVQVYSPDVEVIISQRKDEKSPTSQYSTPSRRTRASRCRCRDKNCIHRRRTKKAWYKTMWDV